jgi:branched-chain amino acid transport system substrate-binding protein
VKRSSLAVSLVSAVLLLILAACSSSSSSDTGSSSSASKSPIVLGQVTTVSSATFAFPNSEQAFQASVKAINAAGGIDGHPVQGITCNDNDNPTTATQCATKLIQQDHAVALGGYWGVETAAVLPVAEAAKIPTFCSDALAPGQSNYSQFYSCGPATNGYGQVAMLFQKSWKKVAYVSFSGLPSDLSLVQAAQKVAGTNVTLVPVNVPLTTTDWAPVAAQIKSLGANAVVTQLATANDVSLVQALGAAKVKIDYLQPSGSAADQTAQLAAKAGITYEVSSSWILDPSRSALRRQELADFAKYTPNIAANISDATNNAWFYPQIIKLAASKGLKDFTAAGIAAWASGQTDFTTGFLAPINWKDAGPLMDYPRFTTLYAMPVGFNSSGDPYLIKSQFQSLSYGTLKTLPLG